MSWSSKIVSSRGTGEVVECGDDEGAIVHLFNENASVNGHTMMSIEYKDGSFWGLSFEPLESDESLLWKFLGTKAKIVNRTEYGSTNSGVNGQVADYVATYVINKEQKDILRDVINMEEKRVEKGEVTYALTGIPLYGIFQTGYRDTCYSWVVRVLRWAGVTNRVWVATRWVSIAPSSTWAYSDTKPVWK